MIPDTPLSREHFTRTLISVRPYNTKELCALYSITQKTLYKWLAPFKNEIGEKNGSFYSVLQVQTIFMKLGVPYMVEE